MGETESAAAEFRLPASTGSPDRRSSSSAYYFQNQKNLFPPELEVEDLGLLWQLPDQQVRRDHQPESLARARARARAHAYVSSAPPCLPDNAYNEFKVIVARWLSGRAV